VNNDDYINSSSISFCRNICWSKQWFGSRTSNGYEKMKLYIQENNLYFFYWFVSITGWNSWNRFQCKIDEQLFKRTADVIVSTGLAKAGYTYGLFIVHH
jgi:hypothetical protein